MHHVLALSYLGARPPPSIQATAKVSWETIVLIKEPAQPTVSLLHITLPHGKSQSIWQKPTTWQKSECLGFVIGWPLPVYSGKTQGGYKK